MVPSRIAAVAFDFRDPSRNNWRRRRRHRTYTVPFLHGASHCWRIEVQTLWVRPDDSIKRHAATRARAINSSAVEACKKSRIGPWTANRKNYKVNSLKDDEPLARHLACLPRSRLSNHGKRSDLQGGQGKGGKGCRRLAGCCAPITGRAEAPGGSNLGTVCREVAETVLISATSRCYNKDEN